MRQDRGYLASIIGLQRIKSTYHKGVTGGINIMVKDKTDPTSLYVPVEEHVGTLTSLAIKSSRPG